MDEITEQMKKNPPLIVFNEIEIPQSASCKWIEEDMKDMPLCPDDIWIVSYPKAGTTWTQQIVKLINNNGEDDDVKIDESVLWVEAFNDKYRFDLDSYSSPRAFKSHFPYHLMPCGHVGCQAILQGGISMWQETLKMLQCPCTVIDKPSLVILKWSFFKCYIAGKFPFGDYFEQVAAQKKQK